MDEKIIFQVRKKYISKFFAISDNDKNVLYFSFNSLISVFSKALLFFRAIGSRSQRRRIVQVS
jgi:hypothetical protein